MITSGLVRKGVARAVIARQWPQVTAAALILMLALLGATLTALPVTAMPANVGMDSTPRKDKSKTTNRRAAKSAAPADTVTESEQLAALSRRVEELSQLVAALSARLAREDEVRREIAELKARLQAAEDRAALGALAAVAPSAEPAQATLSPPSAFSAPALPPASPMSPPSSTAPATMGIAPPDVSEAPAKAAQTPAQAAETEALVKRFGPFRFSGDFRLRADAILRPAFTTPGPGQTALPHEQNVRARYRLRFNFDTEINPWVSFHGQLSTGPLNNQFTTNQDFTGIATRHPFAISEAWVDFHPVKWFNVQGGRVNDVFADNSRFVFDDDVRFNGFNQKLVHTLSQPAAGVKSIELRAGQYILSNPNIAIVTAGNLGPTGAVIGSTGRASNLFRQGLLVNQQVSEQAAQQFGADVQLYRNPNQIQYASTTAGAALLVQSGLGIALSGPVPGTGNATTTNGGSLYSARNFHIARLTYRLDHQGFNRGNRAYPISFNLQVARNFGTGQRERDALLTSIRIGQVKQRGDQEFLYLFTIKGANALISQLTDDDLGTGSGVNIRVHHVRYSIGLAKGIQFQSLLFIQNQLRSSGQYPNFFVPLGAFTPRQYRIQKQIVFTF
jgi:hypothetical protein